MDIYFCPFFKTSKRNSKRKHCFLPSKHNAAVLKIPRKVPLHNFFKYLLGKGFRGFFRCQYKTTNDNRKTPKKPL